MPRLSFILSVAMLNAFGLIASDVYLPAMPQMAADLDIANWQMPQTVSVYLLVLAIAQIVYGPLSERFGRKPVLYAGIALYLAGSLGCASATGFGAFLAWRMVEAAGAAAGLVIGRALIADTCDRRASAKVYAIVYPLVSLSPALAPAVGGYLAAAYGWHADFVFIAVFAVAALLMTARFIPETLAREQRKRRSPFAGFAPVLRDRTFRRYTLVVCSIYCAWFVYLTQSPFVFARLGLGEAQSGWLYLPLTAGIVTANLLTRRWLDRWSYDRLVTTGVVSFTLGGLAFMLVALHGMGSVAAVVLPMCLVSLANGSSLSLAVSGAVAGSHGHAASASALVGFFQIGSSALMASAISAVFGTGPLVLAASIFLFSLLALATCLPVRAATRCAG
ncbi:multidrug effflux MFS transporter [Paraburkholderia sp. J67]|uniref:multidrug effflux MFS transporter n=1 Tax=Paraburkholderia sp. J67 TaxID=2805435 RepID=UPI002ABE7C12|nr:multidrug effflux MFS transporter [Paraburkholderia sp. J67]